MLEPWVPSYAFISLFGTLPGIYVSCVHTMTPTAVFAWNGCAFQICQLKISSLQRPPSQHAVSRQIFWCEVLNYSCHLNLCKLLEGLLKPRLILFSWWNFYWGFHMHIVCFDKSNPHFLLSNLWPIPLYNFHSQFPVLFSLSFKNCSLNYLKISCNICDHILPQVLPY